MPKVSFDSLAVVLAVAFFAPLALSFAPRLRVPDVVVEIVLGIVIGPQVLGWAEVEGAVLVGTRSSVAAGLLQATSLPFIVAATEIGIAIHAVTDATASAFIAAGLLSALIFPVAALALLRDAEITEPMAVDAGGRGGT